MQPVEIGEVRRLGKQDYRCVAMVPYRTKDGRAIEMAVWESECAKCGEFFDCKTLPRFERFTADRRCQSCKRKGVPVTWKPRRWQKKARTGS